ncbi:MAG: inorganic phosphate transporter [Proteobacteria bacterium]|nr:inorganic phosphate transporter [Pseudomonadota bacterium]
MFLLIGKLVRGEGLAIEFALIYLILLGGIYVGWNIGANDAANCIGTTVGAGLIRYWRAVTLVAVFAILGALLQGHYVLKTIGKGIVAEELPYLAVFIALFCAGFFVTIATCLRIPVSTSQAMVGGVVGIGLGVGADVDFSKFVTIAESWVICPLLTMILSFGITHFLGSILRRLKGSIIFVQNVMGWLAILSGCYVAFSMGANNAGNAVGPIANLGIIHPRILVAIGGGALALGAITFGRKVADTVGKGITPLDLSGALAAQVSSAFGIHLFSLLGIPVSTSSAIVGAVAGTGLAKGARTISRKTILTILIGWVLTPSLAGLSAFVLYRAVFYLE